MTPLLHNTSPDGDEPFNATVVHRRVEITVQTRQPRQPMLRPAKSTACSMKTSFISRNPLAGPYSSVPNR